jgi:hypothetical protein
MKADARAGDTPTFQAGHCGQRSSIASTPRVITRSRSEARSPTIHPETHERPHALARAAQLAARRGHSAGQPGRAADCRDSVPPLSRQQPSHTEDRSRCNSAAAGKTDTDQQSANHAPNAPQPQVPAARNQRTSPSPIMLALHINHYSTSCCKTKKMSTMVDSCRTPYEHARNQEGT